MKGFFEEVYAVVGLIPYGTVATYGDVARLAGRPQCARMVGRALRDAPEESMLPCHRVVNACGRPAPGWNLQKGLLEREGVGFRSNGCVDMKRHRWCPSEF